MKHGAAHSQYPVEPGDTWSVDGHVFHCIDWMNADPTPIMGLYPCDMVYTDPPWTPGLATGYRTKAKVDGGKGNPVDLDALFSRLAALCVQVPGPTYAECGKDYVSALRAAFSAAGASIPRAWPITYFGDRPARLIAAVPPQVGIPAHWPDVNGRDDADTPHLAIRAHAPARVFDPCGGRGLTARAAHAAGALSLSLEMSPYRMADALHLLSRQTNTPPERHL